MSDFPVKLYDFENQKCILMVKLEDFDDVRISINSDNIKTMTSSGKIRLVRERMEFSRKPRKR